MSEKYDIQSLIESVHGIGDFKLRGAGSSGNYWDIKKLYGDPDILRFLAVELANEIPDEATVIAASGIGGITLGTAVSLETGKKLTVVRDEAKKHGTQERLEGHSLTTEDQIVIVDDVFTTGNSINMTTNGIEPTSAEVLSAHVILARNDPDGFRFPVRYLSHVF